MLQAQKQTTSDLKTSALLASTKSKRSSTKGRGSEGAFSQLSMPSLAAGAAGRGSQHAGTVTTISRATPALVAASQRHLIQRGRAAHA